MILPIHTDSPLHARPWVNWLLIAANTGVFIYFQSHPQQQASLVLYPSMPTVKTFFTYAFLHAGWTHLIGNMLFLYIFGNNVNDKMGHLAYLAFYLAGGVAAGIGYVLTQGQGVPVLGASGAVAAVTGAYLVLFPRSSITLLFFYFYVGTFEIPGVYFTLFFFGKELLFSFIGAGNVAHTAHVGGMVFGCLVSAALLWGGLLPHDQFDLMTLLQRWARRRQYRQLVHDGYNPFGHGMGTGADTVGGGFGGGGGGGSAPVDPLSQRVYDLRGQIAEALAHHEPERAASLYEALRQLDPQQVLSRQAQLDVANQLASEQRYPQAADAYEQFLRAYPNYDQIEQIQLMLGLVYARYLGQYERARHYLGQALRRLHREGEIELARGELARIHSLGGNPGT